ncbi:MAG: hypothetical protein IKT43_01695 [Clostridia bacterium]|nr:hypothetical protein [Clostridia bacterium]
MKQSRAVAIIRVCFVSLLALFLVASLVLTLFFARENNEYENRKANRVLPLTFGAFMNSSFQDSLESALSDQVPFAEGFKKAYNEADAYLSYNLLSATFADNADRYFDFNDVSVYNKDYLVYAPGAFSPTEKSGIDLKLGLLQKLVEKHPELKFYAYYIERDCDLNFETLEKVGYAEYVEEKLPENIAFSKFEINNFDTYSKYFFKTDHHWNHKGSYKAYTELLDLFETEEILALGEEYLVGEGFVGSKLSAAKTDAFWGEDLYAYKFGFCDMKIYENGVESADYGRQNGTADAFLSSGEKLNYNAYYGAENGETVFDTGREGRENLLVIGESYDNALLKQLACHFNRTYSIDLRYYKHYMGEEFSFDAYVEQHGIDRVLFIGNVDFFVLDVFNLKAEG